MFHGRRTRNNGYKSKQARFKQNIKKMFSITKTVRQLNKLLREQV